jgi:hypothetical protein
MATVGQVLTILQEVEEANNTILATVEALDPALELPVEVVQAIEALTNTALTAWSAASGTPITVESVQALLPNPTPLTPPTAGF